jgi:hypothetical protein
VRGRRSRRLQRCRPEPSGSDRCRPFSARS